MSRQPAPTRRQALALGTVAGFSFLTSRAKAELPPEASKHTSAVLLTAADLKLVHQLVNSVSRYLWSNTANRVAFSTDGKHAAVAGSHDYAGVWDVATGKRVQKLSSCQAVAFRPTGEVVTAAIGNRDVAGPCSLWTVGRKESTELFTHRFERLALSADGSLLAGHPFGTKEPRDAATVVLSGKDGKEVVRTAYDSAVFVVTPDHVVTGGTSKKSEGVGVIRVWGKDGKLVAEIEGSPPVASNADTLVLRGTDPAEVVIWNPVAENKAVIKHRHAELTAVARSADGKRLATAGPEKKPAKNRTYGIAQSLVQQVLTVWDVSTGKEEVSARVGEMQVQWLAFSPDGKHLLAAGSEDVMDR